MSTARLAFGDITLDVTFKDIKNVHLSVHPPQGDVTISAPERMSVETIRAFAVTKIGWIRRQRERFRKAERAVRHEYLDRESHYLWGTRYLLHVEQGTSPSVDISGKKVTLRVPHASDKATREAVLAKWYRDRLKAEAPAAIAHWSHILGVEAPRLSVRKMKTKWGSCNYKTRAILLNSYLAKLPKDCLEYVVLHEMAHLIEPTHNARFTAIMEKAMPTWKARRDYLNTLPAPTP